jgi:hypothetical protein
MRTMMSIYRVLGKAELASPPGAQGAFIPVGNSFDAYAAIAKIVAGATADIFVVDPSRRARTQEGQSVRVTNGA